MAEDYFTVERTSLTIPRSGAKAIIAGDRPRRNEDGSTSFSLRGPLLIMPPEMWGDDDVVLEKVARVLNENAGRFFASARQAEPQLPTASGAQGAACPRPIVDALAWYASDEAWTVEQVEGPDGDYGRRARAALALLDAPAPAPKGEPRHDD